MLFIVGRNASAVRRPQRRPHAADLASDRRDHSDASAAMSRPRVGRYAADYVPTLSVHCTVVDTHMIFAYVNKFDVSSRLRQILSP